MRGFWYRLSQFVMRFPVGTAIAGTAVLLGLGAPFIGVKFTGVGAESAPLVVAVTAPDVRAMLVPSLMALLGRANWWVPGPLRRFHDRFGISESDPASVRTGGTR